VCFNFLCHLVITADEQAATEPKHVVPEHEHSVPTPTILISEESNEEVVNNVNTDEVKNESKSNGGVVEITQGNNNIIIASYLLLSLTL